VTTAALFIVMVSAIELIIMAPNVRLGGKGLAVPNAQTFSLAVVIASAKKFYKTGLSFFNRFA
jgi:hypothetical protein